ncbi:MAG: IS701 family transposase [Gammaproteobacteria bacterium]|nr:IS701 family transposase [Gammaproteobacteria bacterium]
MVQGDKKQRNMERMAERVPEANEQSLQHFVSESQWDEREVLDLIALEADKHLGGEEDSCLLVDESGLAKKGKKSVGVSRQWCGNKGKVDNCQVGVYLALCKGDRATLIDGRLYLPEVWVKDEARCLEAGIPKEEIVFKTKHESALEMVCHAKRLGVRYNWVGCDGFYGEDPGFVRMLDEQGDIFLADVHKDQHVYLEDPNPVVPERKSNRGRAPKCLQAQSLPLRVDEFVAHQPKHAWQPTKLRDGAKGELRADILHRRVWLWDREEAQAHCWHLVVRRENNSPETIKYSLSNAPAETPLSRLAFMQTQRFWIEQSLRDGKQEAGLGDYQLRKWRGWQHHMALTMMVMLFMLEERLLNRDETPLLSCSDVRKLLGQFLPKRDVTTEEVIRQMEVRHRKRQAGINNSYKKQDNQSLNSCSG